MNYDPKFITPNSKLTKTKIDDRFAKMMTDKRFSIDGVVDKYGRKNNKTTMNSELQDYYYIDKEDKGEYDEEVEEEDNLKKWMD